MLFECLFVKFCNMKKIIIENKLLVILLLMCVGTLLMFSAHHSGILIDYGREVYYPQEILGGKVLYKDLFNIYGPLAYQINALLYKIFGANLSTLYGAGTISSLLIVSGIYLVAQKFLSKFLSFAIGFFTIVVGVATTSIFNFYFPYSWALVYGLIAFLFSLYFLLKFNDTKNFKNLYISSFLAGFALTCKYDFLFYVLVVLFFIIKFKNWKALLCFIFAPMLSFGILFIQGLGLNDLLNSLFITSQMAKTKTLTYFYQNSGIYFHHKVLLTDLVSFLKTAIPFTAILLGVNLFDKNKKFAFILSLIGWILFFNLFDVKFAFIFLPILLLCLLIFTLIKQRFEQVKNWNIVILGISTLAVCAKVFWAICLGSYGNYYVSIAMIAVFAILFRYLPKKLEDVTTIAVIFMSILIFLTNSLKKSLDNYKISTPKGTMYTTKFYAESSNKLIDYLKTQTDKDDKVIIFPEGMTINFLAERKSDDLINSLLPLYVETFGEDNIIEHFKKDMPKYIIFNNLDMKDYYFRYICQDYAFKFCGFVQENYDLQMIIGNEFRYLIFKRK